MSPEGYISERLIEKLDSLEESVTELKIEVAGVRGAIAFLKWVVPIVIAAVGVFLKFVG